MYNNVTISSIFYRDAVSLAIINCGTSFFAGFAIFSMMGHMSYRLNVPVERVVAEGESL